MKEHRHCPQLGKQDILQPHKDNMALNVKLLETQIVTAMRAAQADPTPKAQTKLAQDLATAIDAFVRSATVTTEITGTASGGVCTPAGPISGAIVKGSGTGAPNVGIS